MEESEAVRQRSILRALKSHHAIQLTEVDLVDDFKKAAWERTERVVAVNIVGNEHYLFDVEGNPKSKRAAVLIAKGRKAFRASRRDFLLGQEVGGPVCLTKIDFPAKRIYGYLRLPPSRERWL